MQLFFQVCNFHVDWTIVLVLLQVETIQGLNYFVYLISWGMFLTTLMKVWYDIKLESVTDTLSMCLKFSNLICMYMFSLSLIWHLITIELQL